MNRRSIVRLGGLSALAFVAPVSAQDSVVEANKQIVNTFVEKVLNPKNTSGVDDLLSPDVAGTYLDDAAGVDAYKARLERWIRSVAASADSVTFSVESVLADESRAIARGFIAGTSSNGKAIQATYFVELAITSGKITATWLGVDFNALFVP